MDTRQRLRDNDGSRAARAGDEAAGDPMPVAPASGARRGPARARLFQAAAWVCLIAVAAPWLSRAFIPVGRDFSSDVAIPILMVRARHWSFFDVYFWGQDRLGSWHLLLMRAACQVTGCDFYHPQLHLAATVWMLCGIAVLFRLAGPWRFAAAGLLAAVLVGNLDSRGVLFDASQPYAWQLTALLLAWWGMRRLAGGRDAPGGGRWWLRSGTAFAAFLAHWTSPLSGPLLLIVAGIEAVRGRAVDAVGGRSVLRRWGEGAAAVGVAVAAELAIRTVYYSPLVGQPFYRTSTAIDRGHLTANALRVLRALGTSASFPLLVAGTVGAGVAAVLLLRGLRAERRSGEGWRLDGAALVLTFWAMAAAQLPVLVLLRHVRIAQFGVRYFTLVYVFGALAGLLTLAWAAASVAAKRHRWREALALAGAAGVVVGMLSVPSAKRHVDGVKGVAARLEALAPGAPLLGGFWSTYAFSARQRPSTMLIPVPCEGRSVYAPWWLANLRRERTVVVAQAPECDGLGGTGPPPPWIHEHGTLLRLSRPRVMVGAGLTFSLYENVTARALPRSTAPADTAWRYCDPGAALRLGFGPAPSTQVIVARAFRSQAASLFAAPVFADGTTGPAVRMGRQGRLYRAELRGAALPVVGARITARPAPPLDISKCTGVKAYVIAGESDR